MGRFNIADAEHYGGQGGQGFFSLKNDKDVAKVRFLYDSVDDIEGYAVHEVEVNGKKRYVNCLRNYDEPREVCPFCAANMRQKVKVFVPLYNIDEDQIQMWDRGKQFLSTLSSNLSRYDDESIVSQEFEIERNGKPRDTSTTYGIFRTKTPADDKTLEDFDTPQILGSFILEKTPEEMEHYLQNGTFPGGDSSESDEAPIKRRSERRTPATERTNRRDEF